MRNESMNLSKNEMMMVMHDQEQEIEKLKAEVAELREKLEDYEIKVSESGSLAEASAKISHTSFLVYPPNLRIKVTVAFGNFTVLGQLVRLIRLGISFLFVRPRIRYCFFSPERHHSKLASRYGVRRQLRLLWTFTTDV